MRIIKRILFVMFIFLSFAIPSNANDENEIIESQMKYLNISSFINQSENYAESNFPNLDLESMLDSALKGSVDKKPIYNGIFKLLGSELVNALRILGTVIFIIVIHSLLKSVSDSLENESVSKIAYYIEYILIVTLILKSFSEIIEVVKISIQNLVGFSYSLFPILFALVAATGSAISVSVIQPIILTAIVFISKTIQSAVIPILLVATVLGIISNISEKVPLERLSKFFKSGITWFLGVIITLFVSVLSLEGSLSSSVDGVVSKTTKAAVSNFVPVVGKALSDSVETVLGCTSILKNATGFIGIVIIVCICVAPIIKLTVLMISYQLTSALAEPIADSNIVKLLGHIGDIFKILLAIMIFIAVMLIIGITIIIKISNSSMMYR